ncbi:MAG: tripartite tricarboxylate transporter substrate binding protein [Acidobacteria bacterium]|nr:tripartite tricarboxylate transporter substrate binding protein [Acidobacteriota bacterium]
MTSWKTYLCALALATCATACDRSNESAAVVRLVTHSSPGGGSDVFLREMAPHLSRIMGRTFVVDNLQGGSGARAIAALVGAEPDGRMFYATTPTFVYTSLLSRPAARYTDLDPLVNLFFDPEVLYTASDSGFESLSDVIDHARSGGGAWGAANPASLERQVMEQLKLKAGVAAAVITFEGGGAMLINVLNHTLDMGVGELQELRSQLDAGTLRLLAVVGDDRLPQYPDVQTVKEQGIDLAVRKFRGLAGPRGLPADVIAAWETAIPILLDDPEYRKIYIANGLQPGFMPHAEYVEFMDTFGRDTEAFLRDTGVIE